MDRETAKKLFYSILDDTSFFLRNDDVGKMFIISNRGGRYFCEIISDNPEWNNEEKIFTSTEGAEEYFITLMKLGCRVVGNKSRRSIRWRIIPNSEYEASWPLPDFLKNGDKS